LEICPAVTGKSVGPEKNITERRTHKRYPVKERVLVFVSPEATGINFYHVVDIAQGGLAFRYLGEEKMAWDISKLSILVNENLWLDNLPVTPIFDVASNKGYIPMRKKGVQFGSLTSVQKFQLKDFLQRIAMANEV